MLRPIATCLLSFLALSNCSKGTDHGVKQTKPQEEVLYSSYCKGCHGKEGTLMLGGAANLKYSRLEVEGINKVVTEGRGTMAAFSTQLTEAEIELLALYVKSLQKN